MALRSKKVELSPRLKLGVGRGYSNNQVLKFSAFFCLILATLLAFNAFRLISKNKGQDNNTPAVLGASDIRNPDQTDQVQFITYTVTKGDTLFNVSQKYNIDWATLATLNNLKSPFTLKAGQTLKIPKQ